MNMKISKLMATLGVCGLMYLGVSSSAMADTGMKHSVADINKDGMVTTDELLTFVEMNFLKMDKNNDHMLDSSEWEDQWFNAE